MSVSPTQNFLNPPPVPDNATDAWTPGFAIWKSSATAAVIGYTVLEPSMVTEPDRAGAEPSGATLSGAVDAGALEGAVVAPPPLEQAPIVNAATRANAPRRLGLVIVTRWFLLGRSEPCGTDVLGQVPPLSDATTMERGHQRSLFERLRDR